MAIVKQLNPVYQNPAPKSDMRIRMEMAAKKRSERVIAAYNAQFKKEQSTPKHQSI